MGLFPFRQVFWHLAEDYREGSTGEAFRDMETAAALKGRMIADRKYRTVQRVEVDGRGYFVKLDHRGGRAVRRLFGRPHVVGEWENLSLFRAWGISVPPLVALGHERRNGAYHQGMLVTGEVADADDLETLVTRRDPVLGDRAWVDRVGGQVMDALRIIHSKGFAHRGMRPRNILVTRGANPTIHLIDCPAGRRESFLFREREQVHDLQTLHRPFAGALSAATRLRLYLRYAGRDRLTPGDKAVIQRILSYEKTRRRKKRDK